MKVGLVRFVDRRVGIPLCWAVSSLLRLAPRRPARAPKKILMMKWVGFGNLILASPAAAAMRALGQAMRHPGAVIAWPGVVRAVSRHTETDLTPAQMVALGRFAKDMESMTTETLPGSFHRSRWRPDREGVRRMAARLSE